MCSSSSQLNLTREENASGTPQSPARVKPKSVVVREKLRGRWREYSEWQWRNLIEEIATGLLKFGAGGGTRIAVICDNRTESVLIEIAARSVGAVVTLLNCRAPLNEIITLVQRFSVVVIDDEQTLVHIRASRSSIDGSDVRCIVINPKKKSADTVSLAYIQELGRCALTQREQRSAAQRDAKADEVIFASEGRKNQPHFIGFNRAAIENAQEITAAALQLLPGDEIICSIPVHTVLGHMIMAAALQARACFNFPELRGSLQTDIIDVEPSILIGSGRLWKEMFLHAQSRVETAPRLHRMAYQYFMSGSLNGAKTILIAKPLLRQLGLGRVRHAFSIDFVPYQVRDFFIRLGVQIVELYEIPESGGVVARVIRESVAHPVLYPVVGTEIDVRSDSRIAVNRPARNPARPEGQSTIGSLEIVSNDIGRRWNGHIVFCGSRDRVITLQNGTQVMAESIEAEILEASTLIRAAVLVGEGRPELGIIVVLERDPLTAWARKNGIHYTTVAELCANPKVNQHVRTLIEQATSLQGRPIERFAILQRDPDYDLQEVTDMDRIWTSKLVENSHALIERMYEA